MLKGLLGILAFVFFFIVLILMLTGGMIVKAVRRMRKAAEQAAEQQARQYRDETGRQRQQYSRRNNAATGQGSTGFDGSREPRQDAPESRSTQTVTGETVIDNRHQQRSDRKIFDDADGEYVEFEEA